VFLCLMSSELVTYSWLVGRVEWLFAVSDLEEAQYRAGRTYSHGDFFDGFGSLIPCSSMHIQFLLLCSASFLTVSNIHISLVMPCAKRERASTDSEPPTLEFDHHSTTTTTTTSHHAQTTFMEGSSSSNTCHPSSSPAM
jgi:hypothetical protein